MNKKFIELCNDVFATNKQNKCNEDLLNYFLNHYEYINQLFMKEEAFEKAINIIHLIKKKYAAKNNIYKVNSYEEQQTISIPNILNESEQKVIIPDTDEHFLNLNINVNKVKEIFLEEVLILCLSKILSTPQMIENLNNVIAEFSFDVKNKFCELLTTYINENLTQEKSLKKQNIKSKESPFMSMKINPQILSIPFGLNIASFNDFLLKKYKDKNFLKTIFKDEQVVLYLSQFIEDFFNVEVEPKDDHLTKTYLMLILIQQMLSCAILPGDHEFVKFVHFLGLDDMEVDKPGNQQKIHDFYSTIVVQSLLTNKEDEYSRLTVKSSFKNIFKKLISTDGKELQTVVAYKHIDSYSTAAKLSMGRNLRENILPFTLFDTFLGKFLYVDLLIYQHSIERAFYKDPKRCIFSCYVASLSFLCETFSHQVQLHPPKSIYYPKSSIYLTLLSNSQLSLLVPGLNFLKEKYLAILKQSVDYLSDLFGTGMIHLAAAKPYRDIDKDLDIIAEYNTIEFLKTLLKFKANVNLSTQKRKNFLNPVVLKKNITDSDFYNTVVGAFKNFKIEGYNLSKIFSDENSTYLIWESYCNVESKNYGYTPLHIAAANHDLHTILLLLSANPIPFILDCHSYSSLQVIFKDYNFRQKVITSVSDVNNYPRLQKQIKIINTLVYLLHLPKFSHIKALINNTAMKFISSAEKKKFATVINSINDFIPFNNSLRLKYFVYDSFKLIFSLYSIWSNCNKINCSVFNYDLENAKLDAAKNMIQKPIVLKTKWEEIRKKMLKKYDQVSLWSIPELTPEGNLQGILFCSNNPISILEHIKNLLTTITTKEDLSKFSNQTYNYNKLLSYLLLKGYMQHSFSKSFQKLLIQNLKFSPYKLKTIHKIINFICQSMMKEEEDKNYIEMFRFSVDVANENEDVVSIQFKNQTIRCKYKINKVVNNMPLDLPLFFSKLKNKVSCKVSLSPLSYEFNSYEDKFNMHKRSNI